MEGKRWTLSGGCVVTIKMQQMAKRKGDRTFSKRCARMSFTVVIERQGSGVFCYRDGLLVPCSWTLTAFPEHGQRFGGLRGNHRGEAVASIELGVEGRDELYETTAEGDQDAPVR